MRIPFVSIVLLLSICITAPLRADEAQLTAIGSFVNEHCLDCHNETDKTGGLDLEGLDLDAPRGDTHWDTTAWEKIVKRLRAGQMPPADAERPSKEEYKQAIASFESILDASAERFPQPGRTDSVRRLNRTEYRNAIRDLLLLPVDVEQLLPGDSSGHGFDNVTVSGLSPTLLRRYITAAERISRSAIGGEQRGPGGRTVRLPADRTQESHVAGLPLGTRGGTVFEHHFQQTGEYEIQIRLMRDRDENVEGLIGKHELDVLIDRQRVHRFKVESLRKKEEKGWKNDDTLADAHLKKRVSVTSGPHSVGVTFVQKSASLSEINRKPFEPSFNRHRHPRKTPALFEVSIVGPFDPQGPGDTPSRRAVFGDLDPGSLISRDERMDAGKTVLKRLMRRAYRRPTTDQDFAIPMRFFERAMDADGFESGIEAALSAILVNPHFLLRAEQEPDSSDAETPGVYPIADFELASRLSFFLWSSIPDDELLSVAETGRLRKPSVLRAQTLRMLQDERSQALVDNFAVQWLQLRNLTTFQPDRRLFVNFDDNLRKAMRRETELCFDRVLREDLSVLELIRSDTTFLNERLAAHYELPSVRGSHFRPVVVDSDSHRGGLLRQASILAVTSYATRTSPTVRGNWILENILGIPAPPPPPDIPSLVEKKATSAVSIRERLAEHRANPTCAACHDLTDPVGFSLENFDAVGKWRELDGEFAVDSAGQMPDGTPVKGVEDLEQGILARPEMFVGTLAEKLLTFALGRGVEYSDAPAVRKVVRSTADTNYRFSSLILGIVESMPFQMRATRDGAAADSSESVLNE